VPRWDSKEVSGKRPSRAQGCILASDTVRGAPVKRVKFSPRNVKVHVDGVPVFVVCQGRCPRDGVLGTVS
jgi:hypothetical protein